MWGFRTSTDVLDAASRLADAQSREVRSLADYQIALIDIAFATGTLLGHSRIRFDRESGVVCRGAALVEYRLGGRI